MNATEFPPLDDLRACFDDRAVMFILGPGKGYIREERCQVPLKGMIAPSPRPPVDLASAAAALEPDYSCVVRDYPSERARMDDFARELYERRPRFLVVQFSYPTFHDDLKTCATAKRCLPGITVIAKGVCFLGRSEHELTEAGAVDWFVFGEAELLLPAVIRDPAMAGPLPGTACRRDGRVVKNSRVEFTDDLDSLPVPDRRLLRNELYLRPETGEKQTVIHLQRGCPHACSFCQVGQVSGPRIRYRSIGSVCREVAECVNVYGIRSFFFKGDSFTADREWVLRLCAALNAECPGISWVTNSRADMIDSGLAEAMKAAGCRGIAIGMESESEATRDRVRKGLSKDDITRAVKACKDNGLQVAGMFIIGWPWDDRGAIEKTAEFARSLNVTVAEFNFLVPYPGTEIYEYCRRSRIIPDDDYVFRQDFASGALRTSHLTVRELAGLRKKAYFSFYFRYRYLKENILPLFMDFKGAARLLRFAAGRVISLLTT